VRDLVGIDVDTVNVIAELSETRNVHPQPAANIEDAFGPQLDKLSNQGDAAVLPSSPHITGMS